MKLQVNSKLALDDLKGALVTNEHGAEFRIYNFLVDLNNLTEILVNLVQCDNNEGFTVMLSSLKSWSIQLQRGCYNEESHSEKRSKT